MEKRQQDIIDEFSFFEDWTDKYRYLIDLGRKLPAFQEEWKTEDNFVRGCQSQVWFKLSDKEGKIHLDAYSDSTIVSGLIALLIRVYSDRSAEEIISIEPDFIEAIDLREHLSPNRSNGLSAMLKKLKEKAALSLKEME